MNVQKEEEALIVVYETLGSVLQPNHFSSFIQYVADMFHFDLYSILLLYNQKVMIHREILQERASKKIAGYLAWKKQEIEVLPQSKGLQVFFPKRLFKNIDSSYMAMVLGTVFDELQTNQDKEKEKEELPLTIALITKVATTYSIQIAFRNTNTDPRLQYLQTYSDIHTNTIVLRANLDEKDKMSFLLEEIAYVLLFKQLNEQDQQQEDVLIRIRYQAVCIAFMLKYYFKINDTVNDSYFSFIEEWKKDMKRAMLFLHTIQVTFRTLYMSFQLQKQYDETDFFVDADIETVKNQNLYLSYIEIYLLISCFPSLDTMTYDINGNIEIENVPFCTKEELLLQLQQLTQNTEDDLLLLELDSLCDKVKAMKEEMLQLLEKQYLEGHLIATQGITNENNMYKI